MAFSKVNTNKIEEALAELDASQKRTIADQEPNVVIRAPAGSGKTKTLLAAVAEYRWENMNDRICAITYTRAAKAEMEGRLKDMGIYDVEVNTIHVWSRNQIEFFADKYDFRIQVMEEPQIKAILSDIVRKYLLYSKIKSVNINILYSYITGSKKMDISDNYRRTLNALEERYIQYKRDNGLYDFTDYPLYLYDILDTYQEEIKTIDALFVDEFQDVDEVQFDVFKKVLAKKKFFIGDPWQSIYLFRGADGAVFKKLTGFELYKLKYNYRSYQEIIDYASTVYEELKEYAEADEECYITMIRNARESDIECSRGYGGYVVNVNPYGDATKYQEHISEDVDAEEEFKKIIVNRPMILCRTNKQVKAIQEYGYDNVTTVHQAKGLEYDDVIVIDNVIDCGEDLNIAYVAMTRARNRLYVINWAQGEVLIREYMRLGG